MYTRTNQIRSPAISDGKTGKPKTTLDLLHAHSRYGVRMRTMRLYNYAYATRSHLHFSEREPLAPCRPGNISSRQGRMREKFRKWGGFEKNTKFYS